MSTEPTPEALQSLRERMKRGCAATGKTPRMFLEDEIAQAIAHQHSHSLPIVQAGERMERVATALMRELGLRIGGGTTPDVQPPER